MPRRHWRRDRDVAVDPTARPAEAMARSRNSSSQTSDRPSAARGHPDGSVDVTETSVDTDRETLRRRIESDTDMGPSAFRFRHLEPYAEAARMWLHDEAEVIDTADAGADQIAAMIAEAVSD